MVVHHTLVGSLAAAAIALASAQASAQYEGDPVQPWGKGTVGGALLGAEAVMLTEAIIGVKPAWAYVVGGVAGAAGGGFGGYFAEERTTAKLSLYLLAGGMALVIPTTIVVLDRTAYEPPVEFTQDAPPEDEPLAEPPQPTDTIDAVPPEGETPAEGPSPEPPPASRLTPTSPAEGGGARAPAGDPRRVSSRALLGLGPRSLVLGVPAVEVREVYTPRERRDFGAPRATEVRVPVFYAVF